MLRVNACIYTSVTTTWSMTKANIYSYIFIVKSTNMSRNHTMYCIISYTQLSRHIALVAVVATTKLVPYHLIKSLLDSFSENLVLDLQVGILQWLDKNEMVPGERFHKWPPGDIPHLVLKLHSHRYAFVVECGISYIGWRHGIGSICWRYHSLLLRHQCHEISDGNIYHEKSGLLIKETSVFLFLNTLV